MGHANCLKGQTFVITGTLDSLYRNEAEDYIKRHSGRVTGSVSGKTSFLLVGENSGNSKVNQVQLQPMCHAALKRQPGLSAESQVFQTNTTFVACVSTAEWCFGSTSDYLLQLINAAYSSLTDGLSAEGLDKQPSIVAHSCLIGTTFH